MSVDTRECVDEGQKAVRVLELLEQLHKFNTAGLEHTHAQSFTITHIYGAHDSCEVRDNIKTLTGGDFPQTFTS